MVVGLVTWDLHLDGCASLKDKRRIVKSLKDRLRQRFNVSVAETDSHELWQRAELSCCVVAPDRQRAQEILGAVDRFVAGDPLARIIDSSTSYL